jgi:septal ring factor EnvC (AmiA/AmiB activator)
MAHVRTVLARRWPVSILAAALFVGAVGAAPPGCAHKKAKSPQQQAQADYRAYQQRVREVVKDPARADQVIALADDLQRQFEQLRAQIVKGRADVASLNANYDAQRADFDGLFKQQDADRQALIEQVISVRAHIGKLLTDAEWQSLHKFGVEALEAHLKELAS